MKALLVMMLCTSAYAADLRPLFDAIRQTERGPVGGDIWDVNGIARGPYCIHAAYAADAGVPWAECYTVVGSERCMVKYWRRHAPAALKRGGFEALARTHNGGPAGTRMRATAKYWALVKARMK